MRFPSLLAALLAASAFSQSPPAKLGVKEAARVALERSPAYQSEREAQNIAALELTSSKTTFLPDVDAAVNYGYRKDLKNNTPTYPSSVGLAAKETLYDNGKAWTQFRIAQINRELAVIKVSKAKEDLVLSVFSAFCDFSKAIYLVEVYQQQYSLIRVQFQNIESQFRQGLKLKRDYLRLRSEIQRSELTVASSRSAIDTARASLRRTLGLDKGDQVEFVPIPVSKRTLALPTESLKLEENLNFKIGELQRHIESRKVDLVTRDYWPRLTLSGDVTYGTSGYWHSDARFRDNERLSAGAALGLEYNFWDWGTRRRAVGVARAQERIQENTTRGTTLASQAELESLRTELVNLKASFELSRELQDLENSNYAFLNREYREGIISYLDLRTSFDNLLSAKEGFLNSYFALLLGLARFHTFEGKLYDALQSDKIL